jgi:hypothetical protein
VVALQHSVNSLLVLTWVWRVFRYLFGKVHGGVYSMTCQ